VLSKTEAIERCTKQIEAACDAHGYIDEADLADALILVTDSLAPQQESHADAESHDEADQG